MTARLSKLRAILPFVLRRAPLALALALGLLAALGSRTVAQETPAGNVTIVPRTSGDGGQSATAAGQLALTASMTDEGQLIEQGLIWRIYLAKPGGDGKPKLVTVSQDAAPQFRLEPGDYVVHVAYGRANLTRKVTVPADKPVQEKLVLNAGGLRLNIVYAGGEPVGDRAPTFDVYSDERDQAGQRKLVVSGAKPGVILRLNAGIYNIVSYYGDANGIARADVAIEAGKLTEGTLTHQAAKVTLKLVLRSGGDAIADTQWTITTRQGDLVKETVGAFPSHLLAPGAYVATAKNGGQSFQREFVVQAGQPLQVEVMRR